MERNIILKIYAFMLLIPNMIPESSFLIQYFEFIETPLTSFVSQNITRSIVRCQP